MFVQMAFQRIIGFAFLTRTMVKFDNFFFLVSSINFYDHTFLFELNGQLINNCVYSLRVSFSKYLNSRGNQLHSSDYIVYDRPKWNWIKSLAFVLPTASMSQYTNIKSDPFPVKNRFKCTNLLLHKFYSFAIM